MFLADLMDEHPAQHQLSAVLQHLCLMHDCISGFRYIHLAYKHFQLKIVVRQENIILDWCENQLL